MTDGMLVLVKHGLKHSKTHRGVSQMSGYKEQQIHDGDSTTAMPQSGQPNQPIHMDLFGPCKSSDMGN